MTTFQVEMLNRRNNVLRGIVTLPEGAEKVAVVLNLHGFSGSKAGYKYAHTHMARTLAENGIGCVRFDFFGCCESDGEFEEMTFTTLLEDTQDLFAWLKLQPWADTERLILSGQSLGGFVAASAAPLVQPYSLILMCPGASMWQGCKQRADGMRAAGIEFADVEGLRFGTAFNDDLASYNPYEDAKGYEGDVLILRGTEDPLVNDEVCEQYLALYSNASEYVRIEGANHNFASIPARASCEAEILRFLAKVTENRG